MRVKFPFITGANDAVFPNLLAFLYSFYKYMPDQKIFVADFGLTESQCAFLRGKGVLMEMPTKLKTFSHAWYHKASLVDYIKKAGLDAQGFVWFDCDMMLVKDIYYDLENIIKEMVTEKQEIAICADAQGFSLSDLCQFGHATQSYIEPFEGLIEYLNISLKEKYLNSGFVIFNGLELPQEWAIFVRQQTEWLLFEQSSLNLLLYKGERKKRILPAEEWNIHGNLLEKLTGTEGNISLEGDNNNRLQSKIIHVTSDGSLHYYNDFTLLRSGKLMAGKLKLFFNDDLTKILMENFITYINLEEEALLSSGVFQEIKEI